MTAPHGYAQGGIVDGPTVVDGFLPAGVLVDPGTLSFTDPLADVVYTPMPTALASTSLEFTLDLHQVDPALLAVLFGLEDPDADRAVAEAWDSEAWAVWENEGGAPA